jgi:AraC-like DNA-binding protein
MRALKAAAKIKHQIDEYPPQQWPSAETLSREMQVKRQELQKCFYATYGKKISEYQQQKKIALACRLLSEGALSKKEIAALCDYGNQNYFSNVFKKHTKMSPHEWQLTYRKENAGD